APGGFLFLNSSAPFDGEFNKALARELDSHPRALAALLNSLSWGKQIVQPHVVERSQGTLFRINLRQYRDWQTQPWTPQWWDQILRRYPYGVTHPGDVVCQYVLSATKCRVPYVKADWFAFAASRPPLYHDLLGLPATVATLERRLKVDVAAKVRAGE